MRDAGQAVVAEMSETMEAPEGGPPQGRSVAMWILTGALVLQTLIFLAVFIQFLFPPETIDPFLFIIMALLVAFVVFTALAIWRPRPWVYLTGGITLLVFFVLNAQFTLALLLEPVGAPEELPWAGVLIDIIAPVGFVAGIVAFRQARRGRWAPAWQARRAELLGAGFLGLLVGIFYVSFVGSVALSESGGAGVRNAIQEAPTQEALVLEAEDVEWSTNSLEAETGVIPIHLINRDAFPHTFDADVNGRHLSYPVAPGSTTTVLLEVKSPGSISYWCAIPGHRDGMEGTLTVG
jgi:plastocyanin